MKILPSSPLWNEGNKLQDGETVEQILLQAIVAFLFFESFLFDFAMQVYQEQVNYTIVSGCPTPTRSKVSQGISHLILYWQLKPSPDHDFEGPMPALTPWLLMQETYHFSCF